MYFKVYDEKIREATPEGVPCAGGRPPAQGTWGTCTAWGRCTMVSITAPPIPYWSLLQAHAASNIAQVRTTYLQWPVFNWCGLKLMTGDHHDVKIHLLNLLVQFILQVLMLSEVTCFKICPQMLLGKILVEIAESVVKKCVLQDILIQHRTSLRCIVLQVLSVIKAIERGNLMKQACVKYRNQYSMWYSMQWCMLEKNIRHHRSDMQRRKYKIVCLPTM